MELGGRRALLHADGVWTRSWYMNVPASQVHTSESLARSYAALLRQSHLFNTSSTHEAEAPNIPFALIHV